MRRTRIYLIFLSWMYLTVSVLHAQSPAERGSVLISAEVQEAPAAITLEWPSYPSAAGYDVYRRPNGASAWGIPLVNLTGAATSYTDFSVALNVSYEYKVRRISSNGIGYGHICSGIAVPAGSAHNRGKLLVLVESTLEPQLLPELAQLENDLIGDGWWPIRHAVNAGATVSAVRNLIVSEYNADPVNLKSVYIIGHVPVPYSGNIAPDGHSQHRGAWAADGYYGDVDGIWTDNSVNITSALTDWNHNIPGDGKFDQSDFPSEVELQVGRLHLGQLPEFNASEVQLTKQYLDKAHAYKLRMWEPPRKAIMYDNLEWVTNPLSGSGYQSFAACVGAAGITKINANASLWSDHYQDDYLLGYHSGSGIQSSYGAFVTFVGVGNGGTTDQLANIDYGCAFNMTFGSYFGDWDNYNNYLRAIIAGGNGLTSVWSGTPSWFFHHMALGETAGHAARLTMNNTNTNYALQNGGWQGQGYSRVHLGLMGDPSLRLKMVAPPTDLIATNDGYFMDFSWSPSPDTVIGYYIYRVDSVAGVIEQVSPFVTDTFHTSPTFLFAPGERFMVRAADITTSASGSYENLSLGVQSISFGNQLADCNGVVGGAAIPGTPCDDSDSTTVNDVWDSQCMCMGSPVGIGEYSRIDVSVYPNPSAGDLTIELPLGFTGEVQLFSTVGQQLSRRVANGRYEHFHGLEQGMYVLLVLDETGNPRFTVRLVVAY